MPVENFLPSGADTLLTISGLGGFKYQARGLTQRLSVIKEALQLKRTINGVLVDVSLPVFRLYSTKIICTDVDTPPLDNLWPGMQITIECACELAYLTGNVGSPARAVATGSSYVQGNYTFYRPILNCLVTEPDPGAFDEWKASIAWGLTAEEIGPG